MAELSAVPFSELPSTDDGYTLLNDNGIVHKSSKKLSELVDDKTSSFLTKAEGDTLYQEKGDYLVNDDISGKLDKSQYAVDSATFLTAHQDISNKLDTTAFSTVSGDFLTEQNLDEYATQEWVNNKGFLTEHQPISADEWNDVYETVSSNSGTWGTETNWEPDIISASNNAYNSAVEWVKNQNYLTEHQDISNKLDTSSFSDVSSTFLTNEDITGKMDNSYSSNFYPMESNPSGYLTEHQSLDDYATKDWVENKNYLTNEDIEGKLDTSSFSDVSGSFLTAHQDISNKMDKSESANFYPMTGNPSGFLTEHQNLDEYATINYVDTEIGKIGSFEVVNLNKDKKPDVNEPSTKIIYLTKEINSEKSDPYTEWIYNDTTSAWECIGETTLDLVNYYKKNETSGAAEISGALALKEDKIFVAEYNITPYADIKEAYDDGKQIVCKYNPLPEYPDQTIFAYLTQYVPMASAFCFAANHTTNNFIMIECQLNGWYDSKYTYQTVLDIAGLEAKISKLENIINTYSARWVLTNN